MNQQNPKHKLGEEPPDEENELEDGQVVGQVNPLIPSALYDKLKFIALVVMPATSAAYLSLAGLYHWDNAQTVVGTIVVLSTFLGAILQISSSSYKRQTQGSLMGILDVMPSEDGEGHVMRLNFPSRDPHDIVNQDKVTFKVRKH